MADQMPPHDPLGDRLRATFSAERDDLERRHLADGAVPARSRSFKWIPFAVAAAIVALAGFVFIGTRSNDQAVELDIAGQLTDDQTPSPVDESADPLPTPVGQPDPIGAPTPTEMIPYRTGENMCGDNYNPNVSMVFRPNGEGTPALAAPEASGEQGVTRMLTDGSTVELMGGCTAAETSRGSMQWYEIKGPSGAPNEWIRGDYLAERAIDAGSTQTDNECRGLVPIVPHFVWNVLVTDPDGGLIAHTAPGVNEPETRVMGFNEVATPTGACALATNGARWYELRGPGSTTDWVNAQYLSAAEPACLQGEQFGTSSRQGWGTYVVTTGDRLGSIASQFNIDVEELINANPQMDPNLIIFGQLLTIPGLPEEPELVVGPLAGWAVADGDMIAFSHTPGIYRWYRSDTVTLGTPCTGPPTENEDDRPCMRTTVPPASTMSEPQDFRRWQWGDANSSADHIHDIRAESKDGCTRVTVTFGDNANENAADGPSATLPPIVVEQRSEFVRISPNGWAMESAFMDSDRIDYPGGVGLLALYPGYNFAVELMFADMQPNLRFLSDPARVVVDLFPLESADPTSAAGPFGERFVLRSPIQPDLTGPGIPVENNIVVVGFGRPFEAAGLYRIWSVPDDVDANSFLVDPPDPLIEEFFPTSGWAEGWGSFLIELPDLDPGTYIAVFGELPPTDEIGFYGTGQLFRVTDSLAEEPGTWPEAVLLPNVQLPPE